jgi:CDP-glucose 4,6-dehydratase
VNRHDGGPHETSFLKLDCSKAKKILKWKQKWEIKTAVNKTVEWTKCWADNGAGLKCLDEQIEEYFNGNN